MAEGVLRGRPAQHRVAARTGGGTSAATRSSPGSASSTVTSCACRRPGRTATSPTPRAGWPRRWPTSAGTGASAATGSASGVAGATLGVRLGGAVAVADRRPAYHRLPIDDDAAAGDPFVTDVPWELFTCGPPASTCSRATWPPRPATACTAGARWWRSTRSSPQPSRPTPAPAARPPRAGCEGMPPVLCGDFNADPTTTRCASWPGSPAGRAHDLLPGRLAGGRRRRGHTQDWRTNPTAAALNVTASASTTCGSATRSSARAEPASAMSARLAFHEARTGVLASDYAGLVVEVAWPDRPARSRAGRSAPWRGPRGPGPAGGRRPRRRRWPRPASPAARASAATPAWPPGRGAARAATPASRGTTRT